MTTFDPFALDDSGDEYSGTITDVTYAAGKYDFQATFITRYDEPRTRNDGTMSFERPEFVKVGGLDQGFVATDDGHGFTNVDGKAPRGNSRYGLVTKRIRELCPEATSLVGLHVTWDVEGAGVPYSFDDKETGEKKTGTSKGKYMPVAVSMNGAGAPAVYTLPDLPDTMLDALAEAAKTRSLSDFRVYALTSIDGVKDNDDAKKALAGDEFYNALQQF